MPYIFILIFALVAFIFPSLDIFAQDAQQKTQDLIAALGKTKHKKKEKKGFFSESYSEIKNEPVVKNNIREYAGVYESPGYRLELSISADGVVTGSGYDSRFYNSSRQNFTLKNGRIDGALLRATKVYENGRKENFEAVFNNQTRMEGKNPNEIYNRETKYGIGFVEYNSFPPDVMNVNRIFLEFKP